MLSIELRITLLEISLDLCLDPIEMEGTPKNEKKIKTKAKKTTYIKGAHGSGSAKMKAEYRRRRANRNKK